MERSREGDNKEKKKRSSKVWTFVCLDVTDTEYLNKGYAWTWKEELFSFVVFLNGIHISSVTRSGVIPFHVLKGYVHPCNFFVLLEKKNKQKNDEWLNLRSDLHSHCPLERSSLLYFFLFVLLSEGRWLFDRIPTFSLSSTIFLFLSFMEHQNKQTNVCPPMSFPTKKRMGEAQQYGALRDGPSLIPRSLVDAGLNAGHHQRAALFTRRRLCWLVNASFESSLVSFVPTLFLSRGTGIVFFSIFYHFFFFSSFTCRLWFFFLFPSSWPAKPFHHCPLPLFLKFPSRFTLFRCPFFVLLLSSFLPGIPTPGRYFILFISQTGSRRMQRSPPP